jgi:YidC/Oxa1 family membrane protein insertase
MNDQKSVIGIIVCVLFYLAYTFYLQKKYPDFGKPSQVAVEESPLPSPTTSTDSKESNEVTSSAAIVSKGEEIAPDLRLFKNKNLSIQTNALGSFEKIELLAYKQNTKKKSPKVDLAKQLLHVRAITSAPDSSEGNETVLSARRIDDQSWMRVSTVDEWQNTITFKTIPDSYAVDVTVQSKNLAPKSRELIAGLAMEQSLKVEKTSSGLLPSAASHQLRHLILGSNASRESKGLDDYCQDTELVPALKSENGVIDFAGFDFHYFVSLLFPETPNYQAVLSKKQAALPGQNCSLQVSVWQSQGQLKSGEESTLNYRLYFGPKDVDALAAVSPKLHEVVDFGWFGIIGRPLLIAIKSIESHLTFNFGLAIVVLTLLLKIAFYPLTRAASVSMKKMQKFTPEINRIKEKFKDDRQTQQRELMQFMSKNKINPAKGCLPILPQIPVFIAFYNVLSQAIELRQMPFYGWIQDLSAADPYLITPILLGAGMVLQQKLTPNPTMDKTQERIMLAVPAVFTFMMLTLPAGMVIYMLTNTIVSIAQQQWLNRTVEV